MLNRRPVVAEKVKSLNLLIKQSFGDLAVLEICSRHFLNLMGDTNLRNFFPEEECFNDT
jgi:hypothetical protein